MNRCTTEQTPDETALYLASALAKSIDAFVSALEEVTDSRGISWVSKQAGLDRSSLHRIFSNNKKKDKQKDTTPQIGTLAAVLRALGLQFDVTVKGDPGRILKRRHQREMQANGGRIGGKRRLETMTAQERSEIARRGARARWAKAREK